MNYAVIISFIAAADKTMREVCYVVDADNEEDAKERAQELFEESGLGEYVRAKAFRVAS